MIYLNKLDGIIILFGYAVFVYVKYKDNLNINAELCN